MENDNRLSFEGELFSLDNIITDVYVKSEKEIVEDFKNETQNALSNFKHSVDSIFQVCEPKPETKKRKRTDKDTKEHLMNWLHEHCDYPYPDEFEKEVLQNETNMSRSQIDNWFINARRRYLPKKNSTKKNIHQ